MRYISIDDITFETKSGSSFKIKDMREYESFTTLARHKMEQDQLIDEIAAKPEYYGDESEGDSYAIVDHNIAKLFEVKFDLSKIKSLDIPNLV